jgi:hypothetical protein
MMKIERGYEEPSVRQIAVFLHNRIGQLRDVLRILENAAATVHALSVTDSVDFAVVRLVVAQVEAATKALTENGFAHTDSDLLCVEIADERKGLLDVCRSLLHAEINVNYVYTLITRPRGKACCVLHVDSLGPASEVLLKNGFTLLDEQDLVDFG